MLDVLMLFPAYADVSEVDEHLRNFVPAISATAGLRSIRMSEGGVMSRGGPPPFTKVVELWFDSLDDWMAWVRAHPLTEGSPEAEQVSKLSPLILYYDVTEQVPSG